MIPLNVYRTGRPWWRQPWQAEITVPDPPDATTAFTRRGAWKKGVRSWDLYVAVAGGTNGD